MVLVTEIVDNLWGTVLNGSKPYEYKSDRPVHISMAALDINSDCDQYVPVMLKKGASAFIICTLHVSNTTQQQLDLELNKGENVSFYLNAKGVVHLTGYYLSEGDVDDLSEHGQNANDLLTYSNFSNGYPITNTEFEDESDDSDDDDDDEGDEKGNHDEDDDDEDEDDEDDDDDDDDDEDDDEDEEDDEKTDNKGGKKRKLNQMKNLEAKKQKTNETKESDSEDDDEDEDEEDDDDEDEEEEEKEPPKLLKPDQKKNAAKQETKTETSKKQTIDGVQIEDVKIGHGAEAKKGKQISVYYSGKLKQNGKTFDSCLNGKPFKFRLGSGEVIKGWDIGVNGMKVGGKRVLTIPPNLAYGNKKVDIIPPNSTLVFEVELKSVN